MSDRIIATTISMKTILKLTPKVKEFLKLVNINIDDETAEALGIAEDGRLFFIKDLVDTDVTAPLDFTHEVMVYDFVTDLEIII